MRPVSHILLQTQCESAKEQVEVRLRKTDIESQKMDKVETESVSSYLFIIGFNRELTIIPAQLLHCAYTFSYLCAASVWLLEYKVRQKNSVALDISSPSLGCFPMAQNS